MSTIKGLHELEVQLKGLSAIDVAPLVRRQAEAVRAAAVLRAPSSNGELRSSIKSKVDVEGDTVIGTVYTNKEYAQYVEFGTGPVGAANHAGISPDVAVSYRTSGWWISEDQIDPALAEKYHFKEIEYEGKKFYYTDGQRAQPFMYPALASMEQKVVKDLRSDLEALMKEKT